MTTMLAPRTGLIGTPLSDGLVLPDDLTFDEWRGALDHADMIVESSPWWVADLMAYGAARFGEEHSHALPTAEEDPSGVKQSRLKQAAWMADRWPRGTRVTGMSYTHHRIVAKLDRPERVALLEQAATEKLSTRELVRRVEEHEASITLPAASVCAADAPWPTLDDLLPEWRAKAEASGHPGAYMAALVDVCAEACFKPGAWRD